MLTSDFNNELGSLIRSLEQRVMMEPVLLRSQYTAAPDDAIENIDRAIINLIALRVALRNRDAT